MSYFVLISPVSPAPQAVAVSKELIRLKSRINIILPIALSVLLPGISFVANTNINLPEESNIWRAWLYASLLMYLIWHIIWQLWDVKKRYRERSFLLRLSLLIGILLTFFILVFIFGKELVFWHSFARLFMVAILYFSIQYALKSQANISRLQLKTEQLQTENYRAQLRTLRAQVDPHFLFNSLNTLRAMVRQGHTNAEPFIMSLSDFYRKTLQHNDNTTLQLGEELAVLQSYFFLMKSRNEKAVIININIEEAMHAFRIPTLALQLVVENCFKHNTMTAKKPLQIDIRSVQQGYIEVSNLRQPKLVDALPSGHGLEMLRKRYALLDVEEGVIVTETNETFSVQLKLIA